MRLPANQLARFYRGGPRIARLRGETTPSSGPEDWVGSTTAALGTETDGLSRLPDGRFLRDAIAADAVGFLGPDHVERWGPDPALLVKLLDAGERLPVHFHPDRVFARAELGLRFGKTESWIIVEADEGAVVHLGLKDGLDRGTLSRWVEEQDVPAMLRALHELPVRAGQTLFVPAGTLHAIGAGILLVELQEPTDLSVLLEWERFGVHDGSAHLGLGWERVLDAVDLAPARPDQLLVEDGHGARGDGVVELLPKSAARYFRAQRITLEGDPVHLEPSFAILVVLDGWLKLWSDHAEPLELHGGETAVVPYGAGSTTTEGHATLIRCLPPDPDGAIRDA